MNFFICQRQSTTQLSLWFIKVARSDCSFLNNSKTLDFVENYFKVTATGQVNNSPYLFYDMKVGVAQEIVLSLSSAKLSLTSKKYYKQKRFTGCGDENQL